mmetsp:Transcript_32100/g.63661  ORF Transcript_32100/g.63661 Transcript_32100/m.63661 type:complete len:113 (-) Transcript_32100:1794-2132(-)
MDGMPRRPGHARKQFAQKPQTETDRNTGGEEEQSHLDRLTNGLSQARYCSGKGGKKLRQTNEGRSRNTQVDRGREKRKDRRTSSNLSTGRQKESDKYNRTTRKTQLTLFPAK